MLPFERLRFLARSGGDDRALLEETAACLADFQDDPVQLVLVCRALLAHHPSNGPLWWLCARVVGASDPAIAVREALRALDGDRTATRLAEALPFPHDDAVVVLGWPRTCAIALGERPDLDVAVVRPQHPDRFLRTSLGHAERRLRMLSTTEAMASSASHLLVEVVVTSPTTALVPAGAQVLRTALADARCWLVAPVERIVPEAIGASVLARLEHHGVPEVEAMAIAGADRVAGPAGVEPPERLVTRVDCPAAPELLRR